MTGRLLETFIRLVSFDQSARALVVERENLLKALAQIDNEKQLIDRDLEENKQKIRGLKKIVDESELIMKSLDEQESYRKKLIDNAANGKQYSLLKAEIQKINSDQINAERDLIEAWANLDAAQKKMEILMRSLPARLDVLWRDRESLENKIKTIEASIVEFEAQRKTFTLNIPEDLLSDYEHMRGHVANPVVPVVDSSCSACFYRVPNSDFIVLQTGKMLPCKNCYRILYYYQTNE